MRCRGATVYSYLKLTALVTATWPGRTTECVGLGPSGDMDHGAHCSPSRSRSWCRSGTRTALKASDQANCCLTRLREFTANQRSNRATQGRSRSGCRSNTARFASLSKWVRPRCRRKRRHPAFRSSLARYDLRPTPKPRPGHWGISFSRPEPPRPPDIID